MSVACDAVGGVNLAQGICDTPVPAVVEQGAIEAILGGRNIYTRLDGIAALREAIAAKLQQHNGIVADPEREVLVTNGATGALYCSPHRATRDGCQEPPCRSPSIPPLQAA